MPHTLRGSWGGKYLRAREKQDRARGSPSPTLAGGAADASGSYANDDGGHCASDTALCYGRPMRPLILIAASGLLAGCQTMEAGTSLAYGLLRVEPHPIHQDSLRFTTQGNFMELDPLGRGTPQGARNSLVAVLGERCRDAQMTEEGRVLYGIGPRVDVTYRVVCPAALQRPR